MNIIHRMTTIGQFIISVLFLAVGSILVVLAIIQLWDSVIVQSAGNDLSPRDGVLETLALLTVAVASFALSDTILEEEVKLAGQISGPSRVRRFLSRFMLVIVVALSIEFLVGVFRYSHTTPEVLPYYASLGAAIALIIAGWGVFIWLNVSAEKHDPEKKDRIQEELSNSLKEEPHS